jgi:hypothetical protein
MPVNPPHGPTADILAWFSWVEQSEKTRAFSFAPKLILLLPEPENLINFYFCIFSNEQNACNGVDIRASIFEAQKYTFLSSTM